MKNGKYTAKNTSQALILAGGNSSRMSYPKAWLKYNDNISFLEHIVNTLEQVKINNIVVVLNKNSFNGFEKKINALSNKCLIIKNNKPELGRLHSIKLAYPYFSKTNLLINNIDNPSVSVSTIRELIKYNINDESYLVPSYNNKNGHPIILSYKILQKVQDSENSLTLRDILHEENKVIINVEDENILHNINTKTDYEKLYM